MPTVIHIGAPKAASTTIQKYLLTCDQNINYLNSDKNFARLSRVILRGENDAFEKLFPVLKSYVDNNLVGETVNVASNEQFSMCALRQPPDIAMSVGGSASRDAVASRLRRLFGNCQIVLVARNQIYAVPSLYQQFAQVRPSIQYYSRWLQLCFNNFYSSPLRIYLYDVIIDTYRRYFDNVSVFLFEDLIGGNTEEQRRFGSIFGLSDPYAVFSKVHNSTDVKKAKLRLHNFFQLAMQIRRKEPDFHKFNNHLSEYYRCSNQQLRSLTGLDICSAGYPTKPSGVILPPHYQTTVFK